MNPKSPATPAALSTEAIDRVALEQALLDAQVALARTHDLMLRLVESRREIDAERARTAAVQADLDASRALYEAIVSNRAYRSASKIWGIRRALGV